MNKHVDREQEPEEWERVCETEERDGGEFCPTFVKIQLCDKEGQWIESDYHFSRKSIQ